MCRRFKVIYGNGIVNIHNTKAGIIQKHCIKEFMDGRARYPKYVTNTVRQICKTYYGQETINLMKKLNRRITR